MTINKETNCKEESSKNKHEKEVSSSVSKRSFFKHPTVTIGENYIEEEIESNCAKEHEVGNKSPNLVVLEN
jgi:hypothetical protein